MSWRCGLKNEESKTALSPRPYDYMPCVPFTTVGSSQHMLRLRVPFHVLNSESDLVRLSKIDVAVATIRLDPVNERLRSFNSTK